MNGSKFNIFGVCAVFMTLFFMFSGCATIGYDFDASRVKSIEIGKTTQSDLINMFGAPWRTGIEDGKQTWTYGRYKYSLFKEASTTDLVLRFDASGVVSSYTFNTTERPKAEQPPQPQGN